MQQGDNNKQTQYPQGISGQPKAYFIEENVAQNFDVLLELSYIVSLSLCAFFFSLDLLAGFTVSGCYEITMLM